MDRRVRIDLAYDGTAYAGWQFQPGSPTVQGVLEAALGAMHGGRAVRVRGAGRTDSGAHARGQVADAWVATRSDDEGLLRALARMLPDDVRPRRVLTVGPTFHARHDARSKTYRYLIDRSRTGDPWRRRYALTWPHPIDDAALEAALPLLAGTHDWSGFTGSACTVRDRRRTLTEIRRAVVRPGLEAFTFTADGFLTHMVRNVVGTLLEVGRGRIVPGQIEEIFASADRRRAGPTAPAHGLCLERVVYDDAAGGASGDPSELC
jgi:tRNA pseudouridine38-40 synthase